MLKRLYIKNYALIDKTQIEFGPNFNIITGETGAGKSIMLGALGLILGKRADTQALANAESKCIIEGCFTNVADSLKTLFLENDLDFEQENLLRREITPSGKSRAFVNDTPVSLQVLKEIGEHLVDIHSQHSNQLLASPTFRLSVVDQFAKNAELQQDFARTFFQWKKAEKERETLQEAAELFERDRDYLLFQFNELDALNLKEGEYEANEQELELLNNAEKVGEALQSGRQLLEEGEWNVLDLISQLKQHFAQVRNVNQQFAELAERIESSHIELKDVFREIVQLSEEDLFDASKLDSLNDRQQNLQRAIRKHGAADDAELIAIKNDLEKKLANAQHSTQELETLKKQCAKLKSDAQVSANKLTESRKAVITKTGNEITSILRELGIPDAQFAIELETLPIEQMKSQGQDQLHFRFSANKGSALGSVQKVASGGEISRIMLALKHLLASSAHLPTMVFDEIDLGISGEVAIKMGMLMSKMSEYHQLISITHLPQIAAMGNTHFKVSKESGQDRSISQIAELSSSERIQEISHMIGGISAGENAVESAKELLQKFAALN
ncbi:MAG: DNA repair protein RecN [Bacteroidetes bacterium]|nr:DNA repair protein RecN [Bacteroidota bacterium]